MPIDDHDITVEDPIVAHRLATHAQGRVPVRVEQLAEINPLVLFDGFDRAAGRDTAHERNPLPGVAPGQTDAASSRPAVPARKSLDVAPVSPYAESWRGNTRYRIRNVWPPPSAGGNQSLPGPLPPRDMFGELLRPQPDGPVRAPRPGEARHPGPLPPRNGNEWFDRLLDEPGIMAGPYRPGLIRKLPDGARMIYGDPVAAANSAQHMVHINPQAYGLSDDHDIVSGPGYRYAMPKPLGSGMRLLGGRQVDGTAMFNELASPAGAMFSIPSGPEHPEWFKPVNPPPPQAGRAGVTGGLRPGWDRPTARLRPEQVPGSHPSDFSRPNATAPAEDSAPVRFPLSPVRPAASPQAAIRDALAPVLGTPPESDASPAEWATAWRNPEYQAWLRDQEAQRGGIAADSQRREAMADAGWRGRQFYNEIIQGLTDRNVAAQAGRGPTLGAGGGYRSTPMLDENGQPVLDMYGRPQYRASFLGRGQTAQDMIDMAEQQARDAQKTHGRAVDTPTGSGNPLGGYPTNYDPGRDTPEAVAARGGGFAYNPLTDRAMYVGGGALPRGDGPASAAQAGGAGQVGVAGQAGRPAIPMRDAGAGYGPEDSGRIPTIARAFRDTELDPNRAQQIFGQQLQGLGYELRDVDLNDPGRLSGGFTAEVHNPLTGRTMNVVVGAKPDSSRWLDKPKIAVSRSGRKYLTRDRNAPFLDTTDEDTLAEAQRRLGIRGAELDQRQTNRRDYFARRAGRVPAGDVTPQRAFDELTGARPLPESGVAAPRQARRQAAAEAFSDPVFGELEITPESTPGEVFAKIEPYLSGEEVLGESELQSIRKYIQSRPDWMKQASGDARVVLEFIRNNPKATPGQIQKVLQGRRDEPGRITAETYSHVAPGG